jgi:hypothetical protein
MAKQEVGLKIDVDVSSVGNMKQQLRAATNELVAMNEKFGSTSKEAIAAAQKVAGLKDAIGDAKSLADAFNPDAKFKALGQTLGAVAGGFAAVQGAMGLLGNESEDLQKTLVKVQSALAISQGLEQIGDLGQAFKNLKAVAVNAFNGIKAAIGSTGIGLLVVALGTIAAYWDDIKAAVSGVSEEQNKLNKASSDNLKTQQDKLKAIGDQDNILKLQGKSEKEILQSKIKQTDETIKAAEVNLQNNIATLKAQTEAEQRNKEILEGLLKFVSLPITAILKGIDLIGSAVGKNFGLEEKFFGGLASFIFDPEETKKKGDETIKEQEKALTDLKNQRAGFQLAINDINKKENDESKKLEEEYTKFIKDEKEKQLLASMSASEKELFLLRKKYKEQYDLAKGNKDAINKLNELQFSEGLNIINKGTLDETKIITEANAKKLGDFSAMVPKMAAVTTTLTANEATEANTRKQIATDEAENRILLAQSVGNTLGALSNVIGQETAAGKALAIAQATINTFLGITEVWKAKSVLPEPFNTASKVAATITTAAGGFAAVRSIARTQVPGRGGGGGGVGNLTAPVAPQLSPQVTATQVNTAAVNQLGNQATRAYVLNSDIQNNDQRNAYINRNASIGNP